MAEIAKFIDTRWDAKNNPKGYIIGVTPGFSQYEQGDQKLVNMGLARKIMKAARLGFDFCQIDYEALSEMFEAEIKPQIAHIKNSQGNINTGRKFEVGLHLQTDIDLCVAGSYEWKIMHERVTKGAYSAKDLIEAKYILFHTSSRIRPHVTFDVGQQEPRVPLFAFDGQNLAEFMDQVDKCGYIDPARGPIKCPKSTPTGGKFEGLRDWFKGKFINILFSAMGAPADVGTVSYFDTFMLEDMGSGFKDGEKNITDENNKLDDELNKLINQKRDIDLKPQRELKQELISKREDMIKKNEDTLEIDQKLQIIEQNIVYLNSDQKRKEYQNIIINTNDKIKKEIKRLGNVGHYVQNTDFDKVFEFWRRHGSEAEEQIAYRVIAKYMWLTSDPFWADIVGMKYDPDLIIWYNDNGHQYYLNNPRDKNSADKTGPEVMKLVEKMITAVAAKYIQGHLFVKSPRWSMKAEDHSLTEDISIYNYCKNNKMKIFIETAMPPQGQEGQLRIMSAQDHVKLVKNLDGGEIIAYCLDFEHITVNYIYVPEDLKTLAPGEGKYIRMVHINAPRPLMGAHAPIDRISRDMLIIYKWLEQMRDLGMKDAYLIWEMGSYGVQESAIAFRKLMEELSKGTKWGDLPKEFFGIDEIFEQQQWINMQEHAFDPLKGLIANPEEDHGILSTEAVKKSKLAEWLAGRYR